MKQHPIQFLIILTLSLILQNGCAVAQSTASASPPSSPAAKRTALDQFGLSTGAFSNGPKTSTADSEPPTKVEYVDQQIFETLNVVIEKSEFLEGELLRVLSDNVDISPTSGFRKYFKHNIGGLLNVSEVQRSGVYGGKGIKSGNITKLMIQNEKTIDEILTVLDTGPEEYARFGKELDGVSEKYGVALLKSPSAGTRLNKPALLTAMMRRINSNYSLVKKQMAPAQ